MLLLCHKNGVYFDIFGEPVPPTVVWAEGRIRYLEKNALNLTIEERNELVEELAERYYERFGERMTSQMLYRLTNVIMADELRMKSRDKGKTGIMSDYQLETRRTGRFARRETRTKEVPLKKAVTIASDGKNYALPKRSFTNPDY